jgi:subtilase family serine protease
VIFGRPAYQARVARLVGTRRGVPDISMSGACNGAADMYQSFPGQPAGWYPTCGTSEATPEFAGIVALADQVAGHPIGGINPALYRLSALRAPGVADVTSGGNTVSFRQGGKFHTVRGFRALRGYDLASGIGTVNAPSFVPELALMASHPSWTWSHIRTAQGASSGQ